MATSPYRRTCTRNCQTKHSALWPTRRPWPVFLNGCRRTRHRRCCTLALPSSAVPLASSPSPLAHRFILSPVPPSWLCPLLPNLASSPLIHHQLLLSHAPASLYCEIAALFSPFHRRHSFALAKLYEGLVTFLLTSETPLLYSRTRPLSLQSIALFGPVTYSPSRNERVLEHHHAASSMTSLRLPRTSSNRPTRLTT
jgi:hypothetical protein